MDCRTSLISYEQTGQFKKIITDYISGAKTLEPFYAFPVTEEGVERAIEERKKHPVDRKLLTSFLEGQYASLDRKYAVDSNIELLGRENTFSIVTAHQPNIFTGHLYFVYKILHVVRLADEFSRKYPQYKFVPVFYMGSEDADLEELGHVYLNGEKIEWTTKQKGAVGRMKTDGLSGLIDRMEGELTVHPFGSELIDMLRGFYKDGETVQQATFRFVHELFGDFGVVTLVPDDADLKRTMIPIFEDDLLRQQASGIVENSIKNLGEHYKVQAQPREINLFYLKDDIRERIVRTGNVWRLAETDLSFTETEILEELHSHPERFSPNVILRGMFQEILLPDVAFVGGGGETAYWLELKDLFDHYGVFFPMLILRNSFLFVENRWADRINSLNLDNEALFKTKDELLKALVAEQSPNALDLQSAKDEIERIYETLTNQAKAVDVTLEKHVERLKTEAINKVGALQKKMMRAEKLKFQAESRQIAQLKEHLFPANGLQERTENILPYYSKYGREFLQMIYDNSPALEQQFVVITEEKKD